MKIPWTDIQKFLALPAAKQVVGGLIILLFIIGTVSANVIVYQENRAKVAEKALKDLSDSCGVQKLALQREYSDTVKVLLRNFEREKSAIYVAAIDKLEAKEKQLDEALIEARAVIHTQNRTRQKLQKISTKVSSIIHHAN